MIETKALFNALWEQGVGFYAGVPDSLLKDFCAYLSDNVEQTNHVIAANEGAAVGLAISGISGLSNFKHTIINNGAHDSVGDQPRVGFNIDFTTIAKACGYGFAHRCDRLEEVEEAMRAVSQQSCPALLELRVDKGNRSNLERPTIDSRENYHSFSEFLTE